MKWLGKTLRWLGLLIGALLLLLVGAATALWWKPELLLNEARVKQALQWAPEGVSVTWKKFRWDFEREATLAKRSNLEIQGLCFKTFTAEGCLPEFHLDVSFSLSEFKPRITRIGTVSVEVNPLRLRPGPPEPEQPSQEPLPDLRLPSFASFFSAELDLSKLGTLRVILRNFVLEAKGKPNLKAELALEKVPSASAAKAALELTGKAEQGKELNVALSGKSELAPQEGRLYWKGAIGGLASGWKIELPFEMVWSESLKWDGYPVIKKGKDRYSTPIHLVWRSNQISADFGKFAFDQLWPKKRILVDACTLQSKLDYERGYPAKTELRCDLALLALQKGAILPPMRAKFGADLTLKRLSAESISADLVFREKGLNDYLESQVDFHANARVNMRRSEVEGNPDLQFTADFKVPSLQAWRRALDRTPFAVPAPFRALNGPFTLALKLDETKKDEVVVRADLKSDLHGTTQAFVTQHSAVVRLKNPWRGKKALDIEANTELIDVALEAPPMRFGEPPQFMPDKRFVPSREVSVPTQKEKMPVTWRLKLATQKPVRIRSNLIESPVPIALNLKMANNIDMEGAVQIESMPLQFFKKKAEVKFVKIGFHNGSKVGELDGRIEHRNPEVLIKILLLGSTEKPRVEFESDPPLSRQQIVSVLLFNKSLSDLSEEEASSAGGFSQATADGALGLFSLLFLSSTPVESISYDPVSQTYAARVRLDDKTTFSVGSDFDQERQVALRRRLGGRWAIRTELHNQEGKPDVLLTLLEWFKRF